MKKFTNLFENNSNNDIYYEIGIEKDDIINICYDITDSGWELNISEKYLSTSGRTYVSKKSVSDYYPCLDIRLVRNKRSKKEDNVKYWNGGIYLEDDVSDLKLVYLTIERISTIVKRLKKVDMNFAIRDGLDNIMIRITLNLEKSDSVLPIEKIESFLQNYSNLFSNTKYYLDSWSSGGNSTLFNIELKEDDYNDFRKIINDHKNIDVPLDKKYSNILDFPKIINDFLSGISYLSDKNLKVDKCDDNEFYPEDKKYNITYNDEVILTLKVSIDSLKKVKVLTDNSFFKKRYETFYIYGITLITSYK